MKRKEQFKGKYVKKGSERHELLKMCEKNPKRYTEIQKGAKRRGGQHYYDGGAWKRSHDSTRTDGRLTELRKAGLLERPSRGVYKITPKGKKVLKQSERK